MTQRSGKNMYVSALNITSEPPFSPSRYVELFQIMASDANSPIGAFGKERLTLYQFEQHENFLIGTFGRYTYIDPNEAWWDSDERKALIDSEGRPIEQVRQGIGPNFQEIAFIFLLPEHKLIFDLTKITPSQFFKAIQSIFSNFAIHEQFGVVNVTVIPSKDALTNVLERPSLKKIQLMLTIPNPDQGSVIEDRIMQRLRDIGAGKTEQKYTSQKDENIILDDELKATATLASYNGFVESTGYDESEGKLKKLSTKQYPWKEKITSGRRELPTQTLKRWATWLQDKIR